MIACSICGEITDCEKVGPDHALPPSHAGSPRLEAALQGSSRAPVRRPFLPLAHATVIPMLTPASPTSPYLLASSRECCLKVQETSAGCPFPGRPRAPQFCPPCGPDSTQASFRTGIDLPQSTPPSHRSWRQSTALAQSLPSPGWDLVLRAHRSIPCGPTHRAMLRTKIVQLAQPTSPNRLCWYADDRSGKRHQFNASAATWR